MKILGNFDFWLKVQVAVVRTQNYVLKGKSFAFY